MALKSTIYKVQLALADMDRSLYADHALTLALHPSETEERLMVRLLAFALEVPRDDADGELRFSRGLSDADEPALWRHALDGSLRHWVEVGQPDERRLTRASGRADRVTVYAYGASAGLWWTGVQSKLARLRNLDVWMIPPDQSQSLASLARRSMQLQCTVQDGHAWLGCDEGNAELTPTPMMRAVPA